MEATSEACPSRRAGIRSTIFSIGGGALPPLRPCMIVDSIRLSIRPGADAIDAHAGAGAFPGRALGEADHGVLAGAIDRDVRRSHQAGDRGGVDDAALVLLEHHRQHMLHAEEDADHVDVEHFSKTLQRILRDRLDVALDAGVVVEGVDGAEFVDAGADIVGDFVFLVTSAAIASRLGARPAGP